MSELHLDQLSKSFGQVRALHDLTLHMAPGEIMALLGPSGCGKSTTLQLIAGVLAPDRGEIRLAGKILNRVPPEKRGVALVMQKGVLFPHMTVGENVAFGLKMRGVNRTDREAMARAMLARVHLPQMIARKPGELSGGQAQRVALARALVIQPQLLLLDEPLSALDANLRQDMQDLILDLQAQTGVTTLMVTHDQAEAVVMAQRIALLLEGELHQVGTPRDFYERPVSITAARFFGGVNFWQGQAWGTRIELEAGPVLTLGIPETGPVVVTIRPEHMQLHSSRPTQINTWPGRILTQRYTGTHQRIQVKTEGGLMVQGVGNPSQHFGRGEEVWITLPPESLWCIPSAEVFRPESRATPTSPQAFTPHFNGHPSHLIR
jgi:ABC-type Fe3+/spermidine/putrescine transport system ATPase subunit